ncbi:MAG: hypothetical protein P8Q14_12125 [Vicingaceae bacterium]|nr:hypothetical protein [Vicingaceae bacterium]
MKNENNISDNLENEAPSLSKLKKENHFSTPENYFKVLPEVINNKILENKSIQLNFDKLSWRVLTPLTAVIIIFTAITNLNTTKEEDILTYDQFSEYIILQEDIEIEDELVYEAYAEILESEGNLETEDEAYINYLIENDIDINSIIEEL